MNGHVAFYDPNIGRGRIESPSGKFVAHDDDTANDAKVEGTRTDHRQHRFGDTGG